MDLPSRYQLRAPTRDDADAVAHVLADAGQTVLGVDFLRDEWSRVGFDLATDAWVVADGEGTIVAYGQVLRDEPSIVEGWGVVHPKHRGRGIGVSLMNRIEQRAPSWSPGFRPSGFATPSTRTTEPRLRCSGPEACDASAISGTCGSIWSER